MILAIDTSALVLRYLSGEHRELVLEEMGKFMSGALLNLFVQKS